MNTGIQPFSIENIFYDEMDLRLFYFRVTIYVWRDPGTTTGSIPEVKEFVTFQVHFEKKLCWLNSGCEYLSLNFILHFTWHYIDIDIFLFNQLVQTGLVPKTEEMLFLNHSCHCVKRVQIRTRKNSVLHNFHAVHTKRKKAKRFAFLTSYYETVRFWHTNLHCDPKKNPDNNHAKRQKNWVLSLTVLLFGLFTFWYTVKNSGF